MRAPLPRARLPLLALAPLAWLAACGFHLQGRVTLPHALAVTNLEAGDRQSDFYSSLRASLEAAGSQLDTGTTDAATVRILEDASAERVLTVSARNTPTAYVLSYRVKVAVEYQGRELLPPEEHTLSREYSFDETQLLAKQRESDILRQALADDLAALIMHRLAAL